MLFDDYYDTPTLMNLAPKQSRAMVIKTAGEINFESKITD